jgi:hypothetical protein
VDPVPDKLLLRNCDSAGNRTQTPGSVARGGLFLLPIIFNQFSLLQLQNKTSAIFNLELQGKQLL